MAGINNLRKKQKEFLETVPAKSSWIAAFQYDNVNLRLTLHARDGKIYQYASFSPSEWDALQTSQNHDKFFSDGIRGKFKSTKIRKVPAPTSQLRNPRIRP